MQFMSVKNIEDLNCEVMSAYFFGIIILGENLKILMPSGFDPYFCDALRIIDIIDLLSGIQKPHIVVLAHEADAAGLVDLSRLTMLERTCKKCFIRIAKRHRINS